MPLHWRQLAWAKAKGCRPGFCTIKKYLNGYCHLKQYLTSAAANNTSPAQNQSYRGLKLSLFTSLPRWLSTRFLGDSVFRDQGFPELIRHEEASKAGDEDEEDATTFYRGKIIPAQVGSCVAIELCATITASFARKLAVQAQELSRKSSTFGVCRTIGKWCHRRHIHSKTFR